MQSYPGPSKARATQTAVPTHGSHRRINRSLATRAPLRSRRSTPHIRSIERPAHAMILWRLGLLDRSETRATRKPRVVSTTPQRPKQRTIPTTTRGSNRLNPTKPPSQSIDTFRSASCVPGWLEAEASTTDRPTDGALGLPQRWGPKEGAAVGTIPTPSSRSHNRRRRPRDRRRSGAVGAVGGRRGRCRSRARGAPRPLSCTSWLVRLGLWCGTGVWGMVYESIHRLIDRPIID